MLSQWNFLQIIMQFFLSKLELQKMVNYLTILKPVIQHKNVLKLIDNG